MDSMLVNRVRKVFDRQGVMTLIGAQLEHVASGEVDVGLPFRSDLTQQHSCLHAGVLTAIIDTACGLAALTYMPDDAEVLTVEFKVNFMAPTNHDVLARGRVVKPGRTITVCTGDLVEAADTRRLIARMQATMIAAKARPDLSN